MKIFSNIFLNILYRSVVVLFLLGIYDAAFAQTAVNDRYIPYSIKYRNILMKHQHPSGTEIASKEAKDQSVAADTVHNNRIEYIRDAGDVHYLKLYIEDRNQRIYISAFNLLGKKVLDIYEDSAKPNSEEYLIKSWKLPNGVYICTVHGGDFRLTEKFIVAR